MSEANAAAAFLEALPEDRRGTIAAVRAAVVASLPEGYEETVRSGMLSYEVPLERYPTTYNGQPLVVAALASQKNHCALYLMTPYMDGAQHARLEARFREAGLKFDMGKSCLRFRQVGDVVLDALAEVIAEYPPERFIALYEQSRAASKRR
jgi:hypothetical protein